MVDLNGEVDSFLTKIGAFKTGVSVPERGFEEAAEGCHPKDIMSSCNSVIVFAFNIGLDYYTSVRYGQAEIRIGHLYRDWACLQLINFLRGKGYDAVAVPRELMDEKNKMAPLSFKLAAYEAGIGVYGRPGIIITPEYGPQVNIGVVLSDALLQPSGRLKDFDPCSNCEVCVEVCPVKALDAGLPPPTGFDRDKCLRFTDWLRKKTRGRVKLCGYCYNHCPAGGMLRKTLVMSRWSPLEDLASEQRRRLLKELAEPSK